MDGVSSTDQQDAKSCSKRDQILDAAADLIRTEGVHAASISALVKASGTSAGSLYHHFANKLDIVTAVAHRSVVEPLEEILATTTGEGMSPGELLHKIVDAVMGGDVESALIVQLWAGSSNEPELQGILRGRMQDVQDGLNREIGLWLKHQGVEDYEPRAVVLAHVTMGQAMGLLAERTILSDIDRDAYLDQAARLLDSAASL